MRMTVASGAAVALACGLALTGPAVAAVPVPAAGRLNALGCEPGSAERPDPDRVRTAVVRFQSANHLEQTGRLNRKTRSALHSPAALRCDDRPVPRHSGKGRRVVVSQHQNWVWLVRTDGSVRAQGGMVDNDWLDHGSYRTGDQCGRPGRSRNRGDLSGRMSLHYFVRFAECTVGFHQIPVSRRTGKPIHPDRLAGTDEVESHGCIRLPEKLSRQLWRFTGHRTEVVVTR